MQKLKSTFSDWLSISVHIPKIARYGLGAKIEQLFVSVLEITHRAIFAQTIQKPAILADAIARLNTLSFFIQIAWENKLVRMDKYIALAEKLSDIGRNLGGWKKSIEAKITQPYQ